MMEDVTDEGDGELVRACQTTVGESPTRIFVGAAPATTTRGARTSAGTTTTTKEGTVTRRRGRRTPSEKKFFRERSR